MKLLLAIMGLAAITFLINATAQAEIRSKVFQKVASSAFKQGEGMSTKQELRIHFLKTKLNPLDHESGTVSRVLYDSFYDGSSLNAVMKVEWYKGKKATFLEINLKGVDRASPLLTDLTQGALKVEKSKNNSIMIRHLLADDGYDSHIVDKFSKYYIDELIAKDIAIESGNTIQLSRKSVHVEGAR